RAAAPRAGLRAPRRAGAFGLRARQPGQALQEAQVLARGHLRLTPAGAPAARFARFPSMPSTAIDRIAYRPAETALDVEFVSGRIYRYFGVPERVARGLAEARSKGGYFNRAIRDRYRYERLLGGWDPPPEHDVPV